MKIPALFGGWWLFLGELNSDFGLVKAWKSEPHTAQLRLASFASTTTSPWPNEGNTTTGLATQVLPPPEENPQPVSGINVFWIIFILGITSAWHPLGSSVGFPTKTRRYVRIFPLMSLFDTLLFYSELVSCVLYKKIPLRGDARSVSTRRLQAAIPSADGMVEVEDGEGVLTGLVIQWLKAMIVFIGLDVRVRLMSNALVVFAYAKIFGYYGTPFSLVIETLRFGSWAGNELFLLLTYGVFWARSTRELLAAVDQGAPTPARRLTGIPTLVVRVNRLLFAWQAVAFVAVGIWVVATRSLPPSSPPTGKAFGFGRALAGSMTRPSQSLWYPCSGTLILPPQWARKYFEV